MEGIVKKTGHGLESVHDLFFFDRDKKGVAPDASRKGFCQASQSILVNDFRQLFPRILASDQATEKHETPLQEVPVPGKDDAILFPCLERDITIVKPRVHDRVKTQEAKQFSRSGDIDVRDESDAGGRM
jgi:hypothetical protein